MKRGVVRTEVSRETRALAAARVQALRERVREAGCALGLIYGDVSRSDDIAYLSGLCIYWNEGILAVPVDADAAFVTKLSPRVHPWMRASSTLDDLRSGPGLAELVAELADADGAPVRIGLVERDGWPAGLLRDLRERLPVAELLDLGAPVRNARAILDAADRARLERLGATVGQAADAAVRLDGDATGRTAAIERAVRRGGATDVFAETSATTAGVVAHDAHLWVRAVRGAGNGVTEAAARAATALRVGATPADVAEAARAGGEEMVASCVQHVDLLPDGGSRIPVDPARPFAAGEVVVLSVSDAGATVADTYHLTADGVTPLTRGGAR